MDFINREIFENYPEFFTEGDYADFFGQGSPFHLDPTSHDEDRTLSQVRFLLEHLGLQGGERLLDMGCGFGRLAIPLARGGFQVVGVDLSEYFIDLAREAADRDHLMVEFDFCGLLTLPFYEEFDAAYSVDNNFGYHEDMEGCLQVLVNAFHSLRPGGRLLVEAPNRYRALAHMVYEESFEAGEARVTLTRMGDAAQNRVNLKATVARGEEVQRFGTSYLVFAPEELTAMVQGCGFELAQSFGGWDGRALDEDAESTLLIARKPAHSIHSSALT